MTPYSVEDAEVWLLLLQHLHNSPLRDFAARLERELAARQLLPDGARGADDAGRPHWLQLLQSHEGVTHFHLKHLLGTCLRLTNAKSLLSPCWLSNQADAKRPPFFAAASAPRQLVAPLNLLRREVGLPAGRAEVPKEVWCARLRHHRTFRGHNSPAYIVGVEPTGRFFFTGSDDNVVKIWCARTGVLQASCCGHVGEINDAKVSADAAHLATCSTDGYIRVWSLRPETLGEPVAAMRLPAVQANFLHWHPKVPNVLAYVSSGGVCGVWDAALGGGEVQLNPAAATFAARSIGLSQRALVAAAGDQADEPVGLSLCLWSPCGTYLLAAGTPAVCFVWHWPFTAAAAAPAAAAAAADSAAPPPVPTAQPPLPRRSWPPLTELCKLHGRGKAMSVIKWNRAGTAVAAASTDGTVHIYAPPAAGDGDAAGPSSGGGGAALLRRGAGAWRSMGEMRVEAQEGGRVRKQAELIQVEWSLRGDKLMVVMSDTTVRVYDVATGVHLRTLAGHDAKIFELAAHPRHADVLATWGRDGAVLLWDTATGRVLRRFSLVHTYPGHGRWTHTQPLAALEGAWLPDGNTLCVTDAAGQVHVYGLGPADARGRARYDQFFKTDYMDLTVDPLTHTVRGMASGRPPHAERGARAPISYDGTPYEAEYQRLAMANQLSRGVPIRDWRAGEQPASVAAHPPIYAATEFNVRNRARQHGEVHVQEAQNAVMLEQDRLMDRIKAGEEATDRSDDDVYYRSPPQSPTRSPARAPAAAAATPGGRPRAGRRRDRAATQRYDWDLYRGAPPAAAAAAAPAGNPQPGTPSDNDAAALSSDDANDAPYDAAADDGEDDALLAVVAPRRAETDGGAGPSDRGMSDRARRHALRHGSPGEAAAAAAALPDTEALLYDEFDFSDSSWEERSDGRRRRRANRQPPAPARGTAARDRRPSRRRAAADEDADVADYAAMEEEQLDSADELAMLQELSDDDEDARRRDRRRRRGGAGPSAAPPPAAPPSAEALGRRQHSAATAPPPLPPRAEDCYSWLQACEPLCATFVPQIDDEVVLITALYESFRAAAAAAAAAQPLAAAATDFAHPALPEHIPLRACEPCRVARVDYVISGGVLRHTCARVALRAEGGAAAAGEFTIDVPPPLGDDDEFLVPRARFEEAAAAAYPLGARVQVFMLDAETGREVGYGGTVAADKLRGVPPADPFACADLQGRYMVAWDDADGGESESAISAWEVHAAERTAAEVVAPLKGDARAVERATRRLEAACLAVMSVGDVVPEQPVKTLPAAAQKFRVGRVQRCYSAIVPLPLAVGTLLSRAEARYYRSVAQVRADIDLLGRNAARFWPPDAREAAAVDGVAAFLAAAIETDAALSVHAFVAGAAAGAAGSGRVTTRANTGSRSATPRPSEAGSAARAARRERRHADGDDDDDGDNGGGGLGERLQRRPPARRRAPVDTDPEEEEEDDEVEAVSTSADGSPPAPRRAPRTARRRRAPRAASSSDAAPDDSDEDASVEERSSSPGAGAGGRRRRRAAAGARRYRDEDSDTDAALAAALRDESPPARPRRHNGAAAGPSRGGSRRRGRASSDELAQSDYEYGGGANGAAPSGGAPRTRVRLKRRLAE